MVRMTGLEPARFLHMILSHTRLPISPHPHNGGGNRVRTDDFLLAGQALYQLSYTPILQPRHAVLVTHYVSRQRFQLPNNVGKMKRLTFNLPHLKPKDSMVLITAQTWSACNLKQRPVGSFKYIINLIFHRFLRQYPSLELPVLHHTNKKS